jgi:hypothetical protein
MLTPFNEFTQFHMKKLVANILSTMCSRWIERMQGSYNFTYKCHFTPEELGRFKFSFSENGEDLAILRLVRELGLGPGIYVDAGAFNPVYLSNTLLLHKSGWRGINIDLQESKIANFRKCRPNDYNVVACLSDAVEERQIAHFGDSFLDRVVTDENQLSLMGTEPRSS